MNLFQKGFNWQADQLIASASEQILYVDQFGNQFICRAVLGNKLLRLDDEMGNVRIEWTDLDAIIRAADLQLNGVTVTPTRGDLITLVNGTDEQTYEVAPYGNDPCWRWCDPYQIMMRVHAKFIEVEPYT